MEIALRSALLDWLGAAPSPVADLNLIAEAATSRSALPWLALVTSASTDWSTKDRHGREVRIAFELNHRSDAPSALAGTVAALEAYIVALPKTQSGFSVVTARLLRARSERRPNNIRATLLEFQFRLMAHS